MKVKFVTTSRFICCTQYYLYKGKCIPTGSTE